MFLKNQVLGKEEAALIQLLSMPMKQHFDYLGETCRFMDGKIYISF
jgi:hypothetical protein